MPIKQVTCSICNQLVNKAQTYFIGGDKRACKSHEGVVEKKDEIAAKKIADVERVKEKRAFRAQRDERLSTNFTKPHCWLCGIPGLRQDEFFTRVLVEMEKATLIYGGPVNPFDHTHPANQNLVKEPCIFIIAKEKCPDLTRFMRPDLRDLPNMAGVYALCGACAKKNNVDVMPKAEFEDLIKMSALYKTVMKPAVVQVALSEIRRDS